MVISDIFTLSHFWVILTSSLLISSAIMILTLKKKRNVVFIIHVVLTGMGLLLILVGLIFFTNFRLDQLHGILGMNATSLSITAAIGGILAKTRIKRKDAIKKVHIWWGSIVFLYTIFVLIYGIWVIAKN